MIDKYAKYFMEVAFLAAGNSVCQRRKVGAVIVKDDNILAIGWNGTTSGFHTNICEIVGEDGIETTSPWVVHAEANAIAKCAKLGIPCKGATLYVTIPPCERCAALIRQSGIETVVYYDEYKSSGNIPMLTELGIHVICLKH